MGVGIVFLWTKWVVDQVCGSVLGRQPLRDGFDTRPHEPSAERHSLLNYARKALDHGQIGLKLHQLVDYKIYLKAIHLRIGANS